MKVSQTIAVSVSSVLFLGMMTQSTGIALAQSGGGGEVRLSARMVSGAASGKTDYRERSNRRRLNVEAEDLPNTTPSPQTVFVNGAPVGSMTLAACPVPATQLLCGELDLNTQEGKAVPVVTGGQTLQIGLSPAILAGTF
jgi:hypothetical protein